MSELWNDIKASVKLLLLYCFAFALCGFGGFEMYSEMRKSGTAPRISDPHAIIFAVGLLMFPFFPRVFAAAVKQVGEACFGAYKAWKDKP